MKDLKLEILDNFLCEKTFYLLQEILIGNSSNFPWYLNNYVVDENNLEENKDINIFQFTHMFYYKHKPYSELINLIDPIINKIDPLSLLRIKANLLIKTDKIKLFPFHTDYLNFEGKTSIFYINSNNGQTIFKDGTKVNSVENRLITFNSNALHTGTTCSDQSVRCLINFNYFMRK